MSDTSGGGQHGQLSHNGPRRCKEGHELPAWGNERCQICWDNAVLDRENIRLVLIERDVKTREVANTDANSKHIDWLTHTRDWKEINIGLVKAADRQADALEAIAENLKILARRP